jgi:perosamine synthetase
MITHNKPTLGIEEQQALNRVIGSNWLAQGKEVELFENEFCEYFDLPAGHAIAVSSGTAALYLALWALGADNKKVIFPSYVCTAVRNAVLFANSKEKIADNKANTPNISIDEINASDADIAVVPHMYGIPVDVAQIKNKVVIEDCCQSIGASVNSVKVGLRSKVSVFSFYVTKLITSGGQGGMVMSKDKTLIEAIRDYRDFDQKNDGRPRFNFQMTELQAAVGRVQLQKLDSFLARREEIYAMYKAAGFNMLEPDNATLNAVRYRAILRTDKPDYIINELSRNNIKAINPHEESELLSPVSECPNAYKLTQKTVSLPVYPGLTNSEVQMVIQTMSSLL